MYSDVLVPTDGTRSMTKVIECALDLAEQYEARVHVLHVVDTEWADLFQEESIREQLFERGERAVEDVVEEAEYRGLDVVTEIREGAPFEIILQYAEENEIDLIVMGIGNPTAIGDYAVEKLVGNVLGGTTDRVVRRAPVPVMTVRI